MAGKAPDDSEAAAETIEVPESLTLALNLLWEAQTVRTDRIEAVQAELQELVQRR